ncbi:MAG: hypothetical protein V3V25_05845 [Paracoccaceae bacterium]
MADPFAMTPEKDGLPILGSLAKSCRSPSEIGSARVGSIERETKKSVDKIANAVSGSKIFNHATILE